MEKSYFDITHKMFMKLQLFLRSMAALFTLTAAILMTVNKQTKDLAGSQLKAVFSISPELKFFVAGNFVSSGYLLLSLPSVPKLADSFFLFVLDLIIMTLTTAAAFVGIAIGWLAKKGNNKIGWIEICSMFERFCHIAEASLVFSFTGFLTFLLCCVLSHAYALKKKHEEHQLTPSS